MPNQSLRYGLILPSKPISDRLHCDLDSPASEALQDLVYLPGIWSLIGAVWKVEIQAPVD